MKDRNGLSIVVGDDVRLIKSMDVDGVRDGYVHSIDGEYINVCVMIGYETVLAERYSNELEKVID